MRYRELPPLAFLPAVEAAGRLGSFKAAARELHVTPSAVSQQVKAVEEALEIELFERRGRTVVLRAEGESYLHEVRQALHELLNAGRKLRGSTGPSVLRLSTVPFVAHEFLLPRMGRLRARFPSLELELHASMELVDLQRSEVDAAIRLGPGPWPNIVTKPFGSVVMTLVCAPALARKLRELDDIPKHPILEIRMLRERGLVNVLRARGHVVEPSQVQVFESYFETVRAAEHGLGVAIGLFPLTTHWVTSGRLAVPFPVRFPMPGQISLVHRHGDEARFPFEALTSWLKTQYAALPALPDGRLVSARARASPSTAGGRTARARTASAAATSTRLRRA